MLHGIMSRNKTNLSTIFFKKNHLSMNCSQKSKVKTAIPQNELLIVFNLVDVRRNKIMRHVFR